MDIYQRMRTAYDKIVTEFARRNHFQMADSLVALAQEFVKQVGPHGSLVDIGCGTGRDMAWFEAHGMKITGIDLSMGMLAFARQYVHGGLVSMNMRYLAFPSACFEGAWSCASLLHLPKVEAVFALQEIHRILKPKGWLMLMVQEGNFEGWEERYYLPRVPRFFSRYQSDEMRQILGQNGFQVLKTESSETPERKWLSFVCNKK